MQKSLCSVEGCKRVVYAKAYCLKHYERNRKKGSTCEPFSICQWPGCTKKTASIYCQNHKKAKRPVGAPSNWRWMGERNPNWKGGIAEYKNHAEFKKARLRVLERDGWKCVICGKSTKFVHHKDHSTDNHDDINLETRCQSCHVKHHLETPSTSKYRRLYGKSLSELAVFYNCSPATVYKKIKNGAINPVIDFS